MIKVNGHTAGIKFLGNGGGGLKMKTKIWTGNGDTRLVLTFEKEPKYVFSAWGPGLNNTRVTMLPFVWGVETSFPCIFMQSGQGLLVDNISYSADLKTATITGVDVGAIFNVNGQEYTMWYLDEDDV